MAEISKNVKISPTILTVQNVGEALIDYAKKTKLPLSKIDFEILGVATTIKKPDWHEFREFKDKDLPELTEEEIRSPQFRVMQTYRIVIKLYEPDRCVDANEIAVMSDKNMTKVMVTIRKGAILNPCDGLSEMLYREINKKIAKHGVLLYVFEGDFRAELSQYTKRIEEEKKIPSEFKLFASSVHGFTPSVPDKLIFHFKEKEQEQEEQEQDSDKFNLFMRGEFISVDKDEVLVEYNRPKRGTPGRNCRGEFVEAPELPETLMPKFEIGDSVQKLEIRGDIKYIASKPGYVVFNEKLLNVKDELDVKQMSLRDTGSIVLGEDKHITINITNDDSDIDSIGPNTEAIATKVIVKGIIGDGATIHADFAKVGGLTHRNSKIYAKTAELNNHRGYLEATEATINTVEGGKVVADTVTIENMANAEISAKVIEVKHLGFNNKLTASGHIGIEEMSGFDNQLIIESAVAPADIESMNKYENKLADASKELAILQREYAKVAKVVDESKLSAIAIKSVIDEDKKRGKPSSPTMLGRYSQFANQLKHAKELQKKINELKESVLDSKYEMGIFQDKVLSATVFCKGAWKKNNIVKFRLPNSEELSYEPAEGDTATQIGIRKGLNEGEYEIVVKKVTN